MSTRGDHNSYLPIALICVGIIVCVSWCSARRAKPYHGEFDGQTFPDAPVVVTNGQ